MKPNQELEKLRYGWWQRTKRTFDVVCSILIVAGLLSWLMPLIVLFQKLLNPGPVYFRTRRGGLNGEEFVCYKFRSMNHGERNENAAGSDKSTAVQPDCVTKYGRFLRNTNLDELPQFYNVLKGDMSIVGPRPHDVSENEELQANIPTYHLRHKIRPGITGWAQVNGHHGRTIDLEKMRIRTGYDLWYIEHWSFGLDLKIMVKTAWNMAKRIRTNSKKLVSDKGEYQGAVTIFEQSQERRQ
jgi:putative colanic acid biosysnthesis UDP-glucose lipid carrier transferase